MRPRVTIPIDQGVCLWTNIGTRSSTDRVPFRNRLTREYVERYGQRYKSVRRYPFPGRGTEYRCTRPIERKAPVENSTSSQTCREMLDWTPSSFRKDGQPRVTNKYRAACVVCGDTLLPGEGHVGGKDEATGRTRWICGTGRFRRQVLT